MANANFTFTPNTLADAVASCLKAGLVTMTHGSPGIGKSDIHRRVAEALNLKFVDIRLAQMDPTDLNGFPSKTPDGLRATYLPTEEIPLAEFDEVPEGYDGWLIMFDEISSCAPTVQAAAYKIILDRMVGQHPIHPKAHMCAAGNLATDRAVVSRMSTALKSRMVHFTLEPSRDDFDAYMLEHDWDDRLVGFLRFRDELIHKFDPSTSENTFPCPRTWSFVNKWLKVNMPNSLAKPPVPVIAGMVGDGAALELGAFVEMMAECPTIDEIELNPTGTKVPKEPSMQIAVASMIGRKLTKDNAITVFEYIERLPVEYQVMAGRTAMQVHPEVKLSKAFQTWAIKRKADIFGK